MTRQPKFGVSLELRKWMIMEPQDKVEETEGKQSFERKTGRPTSAEQLEIIKELTPYFIKGISTEIIYQETKRSYETISKYRKQWYQRVESDLEKDFMIKQSVAKNTAVITIDEQLIELYSIQREIKEEQEKLAKEYSKGTKIDHANIPFEKRRFNLRMRLINQISNLADKKTALDITLTMSDDLEMRIKELMKKRGLIKTT